MSSPTASDRRRPDASDDVAFAHPKRVDLHCHSIASTEADEALLAALRCPECYSEPADVYAQARLRGMDFVTITDHDSINGVAQLGRRSDVIVGEELTCYFPEDRCKMHVLVWGITPEDHRALQERAADLYAVAEYVEARRIAHAVAHPVYRQNDVLERWHLERLFLLFKGFEVLNGAHSVLHRDAFAPMLDALTADRLAELSARHGLAPRWPEPWRKARTGGSDDHGLLNVGRTWTEFPRYVSTIADALECLRTGRCRPGGEAGSSLKLAHNFFGVGIRYYSRCLLGPSQRTPTAATALLETLVGERPAPRKRDLLRMAVKGKFKAMGGAVLKPFKKKAKQRHGTALLGDLFLRSFRGRTGECGPLMSAMNRGLPPLSEHEAVFDLVSALNRDITGGIVDAVAKGLGKGQLAPLFDALSAVAAQQFVMAPYYFALFHQNRERHHLPRVTGHGPRLDAASLRVGLFTDTLDEVNGVSRFLRRIGQAASERNRSLVIHTCGARVEQPGAGRKNFRPLASFPMPYYPGLSLNLPPVAEVLEWADRQQFDAIHVSTPGPMGLVGWLVARMLRVPLVTTYHTDFPAFVRDLTGDFRLSTAAGGYMRWFYGQSAHVFSRSRGYEAALRGLGVDEERRSVLPAGIDAETFHPRHRDPSLWDRLGVREPHRLLYVGRVSAEKNLALLADAFERLRRTRRDVALVIAGDGPYLPELRERLRQHPAYFLGYRDDAWLGRLYASSDLFVFPSRTDTLGQAVIEAQASGLPVLVSDAGGPKEVMDDGITGRVVTAGDAAGWASAIDELLNDEPARQRMSRTAPQRVARLCWADPFDAFWDQHVSAARAARDALDAAAGGAALVEVCTKVAEPAARSAASSLAAVLGGEGAGEGPSVE